MLLSVTDCSTSAACISVVKKPLVDGNILTENELGIVGSALFFSSTVGKFVNGFLADRVTIRHLMATGLIISSIVNITPIMLKNMCVAKRIFLLNQELQTWTEDCITTV